jgi:hypothetical protein
MLEVRVQSLRYETLAWGTPVTRIEGEVIELKPSAMQSALGSMCFADANGRRYYGLVEEISVEIDPVRITTPGHTSVIRMGRERMFVSFRVIEDAYVIPRLLISEIGWRVGTLTA